MGRGGDKQIEFDEVERLVSSETLTLAGDRPGPGAPDQAWDEVWNQDFVHSRSEELLGRPGTMLGDKAGYREDHPDSLVVYNCHVYVGRMHVWAGDIDATRSHSTLLRLARLFNSPVALLQEMDWIEQRDDPQRDFHPKSCAVAIYWPSGGTEFDSDYAKRSLDGTLVSRSA